jgi:hypothetical protein
VILGSSYYGYPLSTTQVVSGGVTGAGLGKRLASVHWDVIGQMVTAWIFTIPSAAVLGGLAREISDLFGSTTAGSVVIAVLAALIGGTGVVIVFGFLLLGISRGRTAQHPTQRYALFPLSGLCGVLVVAVAAVGIYAMTQKPSSAKPKAAVALTPAVIPFADRSTRPE